jgi:topoisomerase-4 subunit A
MEIKFGGKFKKRPSEIIEAADFIAIKSMKAKGKRLSNLEIVTVTELESKRFKEKATPPPEPENIPGERPDEKPELPEGPATGEQMSLF